MVLHMVEVRHCSHVVSCMRLSHVRCVHIDPLSEMDPWDIDMHKLSQNTLRQCEKNWALLKETVGLKFLGCD